MQFIAEDPVHIVVRNEIPALVDARTGGMVREAQRRLFAKFSRGTAPTWAREIGIAAFEFKKMPVSGVEPGQWLAYYDTLEAQQQLGWTDEEREAIEEKLLQTHSIVRIEKPRLAPPWPAYDKITTASGVTRKMVAQKIVAKVVEDEYDLQYVLAYERENRRRAEVIAELEGLIGVAAAETDPAEDGELVEA